MKNGSNKINFSPYNILEYFLYFNPVLLLIYAVLLFDSLAIIVYQKGFLDIDFFDFLNLSNIPFFLLFFVIFGIIAAGLYSLVYVLWYKFYTHFFYKQNNNLNLNDINLLREIALITENEFLLNYIEKEEKVLLNTKKYYRITYSLLVSIFLNSFLTLRGEYTITKFIINLYTVNCDPFIKIFTAILLIPVILVILYGVKLSITEDNAKIYFPYLKYKKLCEEKDRLLNKKPGS